MKHEIAIIGGGPSGSTAAIWLAEFGFDVCLIEKKMFPRDILCGEFLSGEVLSNLKELNLTSDFLKLKPNPINNFKVADESGLQASSSLNFQAYGLKRSTFDNFLLQHAKSKGAAIYQPYEVTEIKRNNKDYHVYLKTSSSEMKITANHLIAAYGKRNPMDAKLNRKFAAYKSRLNGVKYHVSKMMLKNLRDDQIQIFTADGIYCGVNSVNDDQVAFCFLEDRRKNTLPPAETLIELSRRNSEYASLFNCEITKLLSSSSVYGAGDIYFGSRNKVENGIFMIGDAAQVIAPLAGDGIGMAMDSAKLLANLFQLKRHKHFPDSYLFELYSNEWQNEFNRRLRTALFIQKILLGKAGRSAGLSLIRFFPQALDYFIRNTRG